MIAGIKLSNPVMNAAGCYCETRRQLVELLESDFGAVVTKTGTINKNEGRRFYRNLENSSINSMGLPNRGYKYYTDFAHAAIENYDKPVIQSIRPFSVTELEQMAAYMSQIKSDKFLVELNISCPSFLGFSEQYFTVLQRSGLKWGVKMFPLFLAEEFEYYVRLFEKYDCKFITAVNTLSYKPAIPDPYQYGIGGEFIKKISLYNIKKYRELTKISLIGCGGVTLENYPEFLQYADAVQIGTSLLQSRSKL